MARKAIIFTILVLAYRQGIHYVNAETSRGNVRTVNYPIAMPHGTLFAMRTTYGEDANGSTHYNYSTRAWTSKSLDIRLDYASHCEDYYLSVIGY